METDEKKPEADKEKKEPAKKEEPKLDYSFSNLARVLPTQRKCLSFPTSSRFAPIKKASDCNIITSYMNLLQGVNGGILLVKDQDPSKGPIEYLDFSTPSVKDPSDSEKEPEPPQPFEYTE